MVTPVTMQMTIPMTNDVAQVQNQENLRAGAEHVKFADAQEKQQDIRRDTVVQKDTLEFSQGAMDARNKGSNEYDGDGGINRKKARGESEDDSKEGSKDSKEKEKKKHIVHVDIEL
ncbi:MAG: hypothetical protein K5656_11210 [Lachnospiraceae bacterium]|nr:hypothetical protein [Lachnospiraceae bacterium]